ncbi:MAG: mycothiol synthase [Actinomycetales bacterium]
MNAQPIVTDLVADDVPGVIRLLDAAEAADGSRALSEQAELALRHRRPSTSHHVIRDRDLIIGYVQINRTEEAVAEGLVHPDRRGNGLGRALLDAAIADADGPLLVWAHGGLAEARALLTRAGGTRVRRLLQMARDIDPITVPSAQIPEGIRVRPFVIGQDEDALLAVNAAAFAHHPEQGSMTRADLDDRIAEPWFDPGGLLLAEKADTGELIGFHWTKVHPATGGRPPVGEVYVIGISPAGQGHGLGRTLVVVGLTHLASPEATSTGPVSRVILYVEADNAQALAIYTGLRFTITHVDEQYRIG